MSGDGRVVVVYQKKVCEIIAANSIQGMVLRAMKLAVAADLMRFLMSVVHDGDFATQGIVNIVASGRKRDGLGFS
ncbi:hypothetical protein AA0229_1710 [Gluconobacter cerinus NRIC 0229]|nr:hypothetical protein AA0229_1710 [Gluconobacter cerinus NRIC 0229]